MRPKVLIFDSGVGGLSILQEINTLTPGLDLHYLMDNAAFPYGTKDDDFLIQRVLEVCSQAVATTKADLLVIACNTASTLALELLRERLNIPIVGVVPAIKVAAAQATSTDHIGLLATDATVVRSYTDQLILDFSAGKSVSKFGTALLVQWSENLLLHEQKPEAQALFEHLNDWILGPPALTHIVLGCTHFPLLKEYLAELWPNIYWIDSGAAIAKRVQHLLAINDTQEKSTVTLYWTDEHRPPKGVASYLFQHYSAVQQSVIPLPI